MRTSRYISLGLGVQSTALYYMSSMGELPKADAAIFVDLGAEKKRTLDYLTYLTTWAKANSDIPLIIVRKKNLKKDLLNAVNSREKRFASIPAFTKGENGETGMLRRQCTGEYKIQQVDKEIRHLLNVKNLSGQHIEIWKGISFEEIERMSIPENNWKIHVYPFCNYRVTKKESATPMGLSYLTRYDIIQWYLKHDLPIPPKSSCVFCPYTSEAAWKKMKESEPEDFETACRVDEAIRDSSNKGINNLIYVHESLQPLRSIVFKEDPPDLWKGECSGNCGV